MGKAVKPLKGHLYARKGTHWIDHADTYNDRRSYVGGQFPFGHPRFDAAVDSKETSLLSIESNIAQPTERVTEMASAFPCVSDNNYDHYNGFEDSDADFGDESDWEAAPVAVMERPPVWSVIETYVSASKLADDTRPISSAQMSYLKTLFSKRTNNSAAIRFRGDLLILHKGGELTVTAGIGAIAYVKSLRMDS